MNNILLTGRPGIGKTTVIMKSIELIKTPVVGFFTEELRDSNNNKRVGFRIVSTR
ncbi:nucleoside-triphosphatase [Natranaerofaba carboxydovora]|uniref:nucleoside-triphosphatase n=1 Tax=Natranaerofaba carboxydovora TaxID=2742683 RepID=UPI001F13DDCD|nr:nucleoside-triphosphatase [Natranaerofaba carboxydovora]UMZ74197.1 Nucleoside-triphosphatase THEP1 [Natranaerofaba carboxydovora]